MRFQFVMRNLSFTGNRPDNGTLTFKVARLMERFRRRCIDNWSMGAVAMYDEMAVGMTGIGKKGLTQTFLNKAVSRGVRLEAVCAARGKGKGYMYNFLISRDTSVVDEWLRSFPHADALDDMTPVFRSYTAILWNTIEEISCEKRRKSTWVLGIVMDNLFSRPSLYEWMAKHGVWALGTWRKNYVKNDWLSRQVVNDRVPGVFMEKFDPFQLKRCDDVAQVVLSQELEEEVHRAAAVVESARLFDSIRQEVVRQSFRWHGELHPAIPTGVPASPASTSSSSSSTSSITSGLPTSSGWGCASSPASPNSSCSSGPEDASSSSVPVEPGVGKAS